MNNNEDRGSKTVENGNLQCDLAEEVDTSTTDSDEYLCGPLRYRNFQFTSSNASDITLLAQSVTISEATDNDNTESRSISCSNSDILNPIQIPIVGYEIMEERARFTVYKLRIENKITGDCWYVFRRYTDFARLCNRYKLKFPGIVKHLPRKRWLKNNFDPIFLEERINGLQTLVNAILGVPDLVCSPYIQDFFCLNEPPVHSETNEESRAMFEALEETISDLKVHIREKDTLIDSLQEKLQCALNENENLKKLTRSSNVSCENSNN